MAPRDADDLSAALSEAANCAQSLLSLVGQLRVSLGAASDDLLACEVQVYRLVRALRTLQPTAGGAKTDEIDEIDLKTYALALLRDDPASLKDALVRSYMALTVRWLRRVTEEALREALRHELEEE
jgi:hypothetical protein